MRVINVQNVNEAYRQGLIHLREQGIERDSRNGSVVVVQHPVMTIYQKPTERVLFDRKRDANPFFHLFEALWMLAGRRDVALVAKFAARMATYSDNGDTLHGAYGHRWLNHFSIQDLQYEYDQLDCIIQRLKANPDDRRCVLGMWDPEVDLNNPGKDVPCNTQAYFLIRRENDLLSYGGEALYLDMTVMCRSNDIIWGAYGANAVHFSVLLEYMALAIGVRVGVMYQLSNNFHAYTNVLETTPTPEFSLNPYTAIDVSPHPLMSIPVDDWRKDLFRFMDLLEDKLEPPATHKFPFFVNDPFFMNVAYPMYRAWQCWKQKDFSNAFVFVRSIMAGDWRLACGQWISRRQANYNRAKDDGVNHEQQ